MKNYTKSLLILVLVGILVSCVPGPIDSISQATRVPKEDVRTYEPFMAGYTAYNVPVTDLSGFSSSYNSLLMVVFVPNFSTTGPTLQCVFMKVYSGGGPSCVVLQATSDR
ncbi:hypothetical protein A3K34_04540 [candidate division WWE3 bacterium RIFOXYC1_FULL_40_10]|uniref:Lipoprotein n=1 Tax=candidate division WWE3 bacterium RIFOXYA2_FULL_46_9 TaxID=1802636 RepID=A0A1F4W132_UNCKA|nr:MAG: hypothetical protein A3K58_04540 [candidate division WWE3 bacterium RIFOXYB1_FULL_40_22]OGC62111.1 MAG: hypothetical protein A3K37_04540 [candidate division WWE3 bacterium RIFOXYA1_FULL_40_11]OGC63124.1 MAG: hypothetical protein A2264_00285 [candidate division WWE3 bacterium RIFOXYA2_FULL_46_9]OGC64946.1 MAG: hypothetical protein A2326_02825 [candidate division WWE3 bacterium RIFOXYB2_FULL_41_6]OGC66494.1 MAG: hypothetical protein A3K34_04540 [candidate division WWE3 bacterium RIFOXYC1_